MKNQHTKGEWSLHFTRQLPTGRKNQYQCHVSSNKSDLIVAKVNGYGVEQAEANAKLIAAAPELLHWLDELLTDTNVLHALNTYWPEGKKKALEAIKKATE